MSIVSKIINSVTPKHLAIINLGSYTVIAVTGVTFVCTMSYIMYNHSKNIDNIHVDSIIDEKIVNKPIDQKLYYNLLRDSYVDNQQLKNMVKLNNSPYKPNKYFDLNAKLMHSAYHIFELHNPDNYTDNEKHIVQNIIDTKEYKNHPLYKSIYKKYTSFPYDLQKLSDNDIHHAIAYYMYAEQVEKDNLLKVRNGFEKKWELTSKRIKNAIDNLKHWRN